MPSLTLTSQLPSPRNLLVVKNINGSVKIEVHPWVSGIQVEALVDGGDDEECRSVKLEVSSTSSVNTVSVKMPDARPSERTVRGSTVINNFN